MVLLVGGMIVAQERQCCARSQRKELVMGTAWIDCANARLKNDLVGKVDNSECKSLDIGFSILGSCTRHQHFD